MCIGMQESHLGKIINQLNKYSIGIEISNPGHDNNYKKFSKNKFNQY